jgi:hypothetical protein
MLPLWVLSSHYELITRIKRRDRAQRYAATKSGSMAAALQIGFADSSIDSERGALLLCGCRLQPAPLRACSHPESRSDLECGGNAAALGAEFARRTLYAD